MLKAVKCFAPPTCLKGLVFLNVFHGVNLERGYNGVCTDITSQVSAGGTGLADACETARWFSHFRFCPSGLPNRGHVLREVQVAQQLLSLSGHLIQCIKSYVKQKRPGR